jgi:hypothetical protein
VALVQWTCRKWARLGRRRVEEKGGAPDSINCRRRRAGRGHSRFQAVQGGDAQVHRLVCSVLSLDSAASGRAPLVPIPQWLKSTSARGATRSKAATRPGFKFRFNANACRRGTQETHHHASQATASDCPPSTRTLRARIRPRRFINWNRPALPSLAKERDQQPCPTTRLGTRPSTGFQAKHPYDGGPRHLCAHQRPATETPPETLPSERTDRSRRHRQRVVTSSSTHRRPRRGFPDRVADRSYRRSTVVYRQRRRRHRTRPHSRTRRTAAGQPRPSRRSRTRSRLDGLRSGRRRRRRCGRHWGRRSSREEGGEADPSRARSRGLWEVIPRQATHLSNDKSTPRTNIPSWPLLTPIGRAASLAPTTFTTASDSATRLIIRVRSLSRYFQSAPLSPSTTIHQLVPTCSAAANAARRLLLADAHLRFITIRATNFSRPTCRVPRWSYPSSGRIFSAPRRQCAPSRIRSLANSPVGSIDLLLSPSSTGTTCARRSVRAEHLAPRSRASTTVLGTSGRRDRDGLGERLVLGPRSASDLCRLTGRRRRRRQCRQKRHRRHHHYRR